MSTFISVLIIVFLVTSVGKLFLALADAKRDDDLYKKQEQKIEELQSRINELEESL